MLPCKDFKKEAFSETSHRLRRGEEEESRVPKFRFLKQQGEGWWEEKAPKGLAHIYGNAVRFSGPPGELWREVLSKINSEGFVSIMPYS